MSTGTCDIGICGTVKDCFIYLYTAFKAPELFPAGIVTMITTNAVKKQGAKIFSPISFYCK